MKASCRTCPSIAELATSMPQPPGSTPRSGSTSPVQSVLRSRHERRYRLQERQCRPCRCRGQPVPQQGILDRGPVLALPADHRRQRSRRLARPLQRAHHRRHQAPRQGATDTSAIARYFPGGIGRSSIVRAQRQAANIASLVRISREGGGCNGYSSLPARMRRSGCSLPPSPGQLARILGLSPLALRRRAPALAKSCEPMP